MGCPKFKGQVVITGKGQSRSNENFSVDQYPTLLDESSWPLLQHGALAFIMLCYVVMFINLSLKKKH